MSGVPTVPSAPRHDTDPLVGALINGKFQVLAVIANGGMGRIYRGEQHPLGRPVAIKVLHTKYTSSQEDPAFQRRFFLEASILSKLQHPNIVTVFDYGRIEGMEEESYFMAMEFLQGETLHRRLRALGALPPVEAIGVCRQIARGLREAHRQGVVHRDLKPSNIMLVPENDGTEIVKILDFGLVKVLADESEELTKEGTFLGSPRYMSPEQIAHGRVDHRTDIYSLGVILYHCLCGRTPFENENSVHTLMAHLQSPVPPMRERNPAIDVPEVLETFVRRCLEKDANARPAAMEDYLRGLRDCEVALGLAPSGTPTMASGQFISGPAHALHPSGPHEPSGSTSWSGVGSQGTLPVTPIATAPTMQSPAAGPPAAFAPAPPAPAPAAPSRAPTYALAAALALVAVAAVAVVLLRAKPADERPASPPPTAAPAPPQPPPAELREYRLVIDSNTPGAQVYEGAALLGATPLTLVVDNNAVRAAPRRLEVRLDGYEPFAVAAQPSSEPSVRVIANLAPSRADAAPAAPPRPQVARPSQRPPRTPAPTPPRPPPNDDIRSHR